MADITFWFISALTKISAFFVVSSKSLLYSAYSLLVTFLGITALYVFLWADFLAVVQVVVYVGGILVLIIFGIMLTNRIASIRLSQTNIQQGLGGVFSLWLFIIISIVISKTKWYQISPVEPSSTVRDVGTLLLTKYLLPFEAVSVLLLGALIGAAVLSRKAN